MAKPKKRKTPKKRKKNSSSSKTTRKPSLIGRLFLWVPVLIIVVPIGFLMVHKLLQSSGTKDFKPLKVSYKDSEQRQKYPFELALATKKFPVAEREIKTELRGDKKVADILFIRHLHRPTDGYEWFGEKYYNMMMKSYIWYYQLCVLMELEDHNPDVIFKEGNPADITELEDDDDKAKLSQLFPKNWREEPFDYWRFSQRCAYIKSYTAPRVYMLMQARDYNRKVVIKQTCEPGEMAAIAVDMKNRGELPDEKNHRVPTFEPVDIPGKNLSDSYIDIEKPLVGYMDRYIKDNPGKKVAVVLGAIHSISPYFHPKRKPYVRSVFFRNVWDAFLEEGRAHVATMKD